MDKVKKMDCRANRDVILEVRKPLQPNFCERPSSHSVQEQPIEGTHATDNDCERKDHAS